MQPHNMTFKRLTVLLLFSLQCACLCAMMEIGYSYDNETIQLLLQAEKETPEYLPWQDVFNYLKVKNIKKFSALAFVQAAMQAPVGELIQQAALVCAAEKSQKDPVKLFSDVLAGFYLKHGKNKNQKFLCAFPTICQKIHHDEKTYFATPTFSHPSRLLASANSDTASLFCTKTGDLVKQFKLKKKPIKLYFDVDTSCLLAKDSEGKMFSTPTELPLQSKFFLKSETKSHFIAPLSDNKKRDSVNELAPKPSILTGDGSYRIVSTKESKTIWDFNLDMPIINYPSWQKSLLQDNKDLCKAALSKDGKLGVTMNESSITLWDLYRMLSPAQFLTVEAIRRRAYSEKPLFIPKDSWAGKALKQLDSPARHNLEMRWKAILV